MLMLSFLFGVLVGGIIGFAVSVICRMATMNERKEILQRNQTGEDHVRK